MTDAIKIDSCLKHFSGTAPIFAQPHFALFPGASQIISVNGSWMRSLVSDALRDNGLLAVAVCRPGWELEESEFPVYHTEVCLARIVNPLRPADLQDRIQMTGIARARVISELRSATDYRLGQLEIVADHCSAKPQIDRRQRKVELISLLRLLVPHVIRNDLFQIWIDEEPPLGSICDMIANLLCLDPQKKQELLAERDVDLRSDLLLDRLRTMYRRQRILPTTGPAVPTFSAH